MEPTIRNVIGMTFLWTMALLVPILLWAHFVDNLRFVIL